MASVISGSELRGKPQVANVSTRDASVAATRRPAAPALAEPHGNIGHELAAWSCGSVY